VVGDLIGEGFAQERPAVGETPNLAARLQALAEPGTVVISSGTRNLTGGLFDYRDLGQHSLKGFSEPVHVCQVLGLSKIESRFEARHLSGTSSLLGREEELDLLLRRWEEAKRGEGRVVLLTGEPGIGKSRIARALQDRIGSDPHTALSYFCSPLHQSSALYPIIGQLTRAAGIERDDSAEVKLDKLQFLSAKSSGNLSENMPLFAALLSIPGGDLYPLPEMTPQRRKERTLAALLDHVKGSAASQPILMQVEDLHWIDPTSLELLSLAIDQISGQRILLLATARPEFTPPWPSHPHISNISLNRLGRPDGEALILDVTKTKPLPAEIRDQIIERTDGVPLFIEELTKSVIESGLLREKADHYELTGPLPPLAIPSTLHASLLARLDRLSAVKDVAQTAAVIGREFSYPLIAAATVLAEGNLNEALAQLVAAQLIYQRGVPPDATYQFKHALVQDASYASLLRSRRQQLHSQIARALEERFSDIVATEPETLAHHYTEAGITNAALSYWLKAGQRATGHTAYRESVRHLERGLAIINTLPESADRDRRELSFQIALGTPLIALGGWAARDFEVRSDRATVLADKLGEVHLLYRSHSAQWLYCVGSGNHRRARAIAERGRNLAMRHQGDRLMRLGAHNAMGVSLLFGGEFAAAQKELQRVLALYDPERDRSMQTFANLFAAGSAYLAWALWILGYPERAARMQDQASDYAAELNHPLTIGFVHINGGHLEQFCGNVAAVLAHTKALTGLMMEHGVPMPTWRGMTNILEGWATALSGSTEYGIDLMQRGLAARESHNSSVHHSFYMSLLAQIHARVGNVKTALDLCSAAQERAQRTEEHIWLGELHRIEGDVRSAAGHPLIEVEGCFRRAFDVSHRQGAKMFELRAAMALAKLWRDQGRDVEAHDLLAPIYCWFTEGFESVDLKDANALLAELSK
jgi:predicted ATPase